MDINNMRQRRICAKSHYKMTCGCCGKTIHRGDEITQVLGSRGRMRARTCTAHVSYGDEDFMRAAAANANSGIKTTYAYSPTRNRWVHLACRPQYFKDWGNGSVGYFPYPTAYSHSLEERIAIASNDPDWAEDIWDIPRPKWRWGKERLAAAIIPLQQNWRRKKWVKKIVDAVTVLDKASKEAIYKWQNDEMYQISGFLGLEFPRPPINPACRRYSPPCNEEYRSRWYKMVNRAACTLDYANREWEYEPGQHDILEEIRKGHGKLKKKKKRKNKYFIKK